MTKDKRNKRNKRNILLICSDQHSIFQTGCYGNPVVHTPNLDRIAEEGTRFETVYCNNPICVPSRASFTTGLYSHDIPSFDNAMPYTGLSRDACQKARGSKSFGHRLAENGYRVTTVGKLHYRNMEDDTGFADQRVPLHIKNGTGDVYSLLAEPGMNKWTMGENIRKAQKGEAPYYSYDKKVTEVSLQCLKELKEEERPWLLYVGYTFPHPPFKGPKETWNLYRDEDLPIPNGYRPEDIPDHEKYRFMRWFYGYDKGYSEAEVKRAVHSYYAMCSFLDLQIGRLMEQLKENNLEDNTIIIYTTDHGEMLGEHGLWGKNCNYEPSARVPFLMKGEGIPAGRVNQSISSLVDLYPTILDCAGIEKTEEEKMMPGTSLLEIAENEEYRNRDAFSEYFATGSNTGEFMLRHDKWKLLYYVGQPKQLFNIEEDPAEMHDLSKDEAYAGIIRDLETRLRRIADPEAIYQKRLDAREAMLNSYGGREYVKKHFEPIIFSPAPNTGTEK